jgi:predicted metallopeptidase
VKAADGNGHVTPALLLRWNNPERPLPVRLLQSRQHRTPGPLREPPPWLPTGPEGKPFDFCGHVRRLIADIVSRCQPLAHVDVSRLLLGVTVARNRRAHGLQARITPLRFAHGSLLRRRRGTIFQVQRYFLGNHEFLYLLTFCLPRFLDQDFADKFVTLFHELYHINPDFNGDLRRHDGRYAFHSHSQRGYDKHMAQLARAYLAGRPDPGLHAFLRLDFAQLQHRHGAIAGVVVPRPKVIAVACQR